MPRPVRYLALIAVVAATVKPHPALAVERMAAVQETIVTCDEAAPLPAVLTYRHDRNGYCDLVGLGRARISVGNQPLWQADAEVRNVPGGVELTGRVSGANLRVLAVPLLVGRDTMSHEGAAVIVIEATPPATVTVEFGDMRQTAAWSPGPEQLVRGEWLSPSRGFEGGTVVEPLGDLRLLSRDDIEVAVAVRGPEPLQTVEGGVSLSCGTGRTWLLVAFAGTGRRAVEIAGLDPSRALDEALSSASRVLENAWIQTPEGCIDQAFASALMNLEYSWIRPLGWVESINHWSALWHMQHSPAADLIGQQDRARECILSLVERQFEDGRIPQFWPNGATRIDFGGSEQFYTWQVQHHWRSTGSRSFAAAVYPRLLRAVEAVHALYDPDGDGLLSWGQQIGNQEDYVSTPGDGASPSMAAIEMWRTLAELAEGVGLEAEARSHRSRADRVQNELFGRLWLREYGHLAFYEDAHGEIHRQGQYHTLIQPVLFDLTDPLDGWTSVAHLRDTLEGPNGEVYASANFPAHIPSTTGCQAGAAQQPWAAWALAAVGLADEAVRPLRWIAQRVCDPPNLGSWPEVYGPDASYFSPPAGVYVQAVVEGLFGAVRDEPRRELRLAPGIPPGWPSARVRLPGMDLAYRQSERVRAVDVALLRPLALKLAWPLPVAEVTSVRLNGKTVPYDIEPNVRGVLLRVAAGPATRFRMEVRLRPIAAHASHPDRVAEGDEVTVQLRGCRAVGVIDRQGLLEWSSVKGDTVTLGVRTGLLADAERFGAEGTRHYSRRTLFLDCLAGDLRFWLPVRFTVVSPVSVTVGPVGEDGSVAATVTNNRSTPLSERVQLQWAGAIAETHLHLNPGEATSVRLAPPLSHLALLAPGANDLAVRLESGRELRVPVSVVAPLAAHGALGLALAGRCATIELPDDALLPDTSWRSWREWLAYGHPPWAASRPPLEALEGSQFLEPAELPGIRFRLYDRQAAVASAYLGRSAVTVPVSGHFRRIYLLVLPMLDNHDVHARVGEVAVLCGRGTVVRRSLYFPGDLDWWNPPEIVGGFATLGSGWSSSIAVHTHSAVMNVIEVDLGAVRAVDAITLTAVGEHPALALVSAAGLGPLDATALPAPLRPPMELRDPIVLFDFEDGSLDGWEARGDAWRVSEAAGDHWGRRGTGRRFADSLMGGEQLTGCLISPPFEVALPKLGFYVGGAGAENGIRLLDAQTGEVLRTAAPPGRAAPFQWTVWDLSDQLGKAVRLEAVDNAARQSYAWIALDTVTLLP